MRSSHKALVQALAVGAALAALPTAALAQTTYLRQDAPRPAAATSTNQTAMTKKTASAKKTTGAKTAAKAPAKPAKS
jgi:hypothetical protein